MTGIRARGFSFGGVGGDELLTHGTPLYAYDLTAMRAEVQELRAAFESSAHLVCYAMKANSAGPIVRAFAEEGCGADIVSGAELELALRSGIAPERIVFSGVAKTNAEIDQALAAGPEGVLALQAESIEELDRIAARASAVGKGARVSLRINPSVERSHLHTHEHIATGHDDAKFGIPKRDIRAALERVTALPSLTLVGLTDHIGSQFTEMSAYLEAAGILFDLARSLPESLRASLRFVDTGGGFGIDYGAGCPSRPADFVRATRKLFAEKELGHLELHIEPGRCLVGSHGILISEVIQAKVTPYGSPDGDARAKRWLMINAGMNDLIRPALYQAHHRIVPFAATSAEALVDYRVVGPVCESSDDFGTHSLPSPAPSHVAILDAGAYGFTMASEYNGRPLATEVFIESGAITSVQRNRADWVARRLG